MGGTINVEGIHILSQAVHDVLEIEKCPICLEKLRKTVILWPCAHRFCGGCIATVHQSNRAGKIPCPLCKQAVSRRCILPYEEEQKTYGDLVQALVSAMSLDLGFDITSFDGQRLNEPLNSKQDKKPIFTKTNILKKPSTGKTNKTKRVTRLSGRNTLDHDKIGVALSVKTVNGLSTKTNVIGQNKVESWLDSAKFAEVQPDCLTENVVVDVHNSENRQLTSSEEQLQSVTQVINKTKKSVFKYKIKQNTNSNLPSDIDEIKPFDQTLDGNSVVVIDGKIDSELEPSKTKDVLTKRGAEFITRTYSSRNVITNPTPRKRIRNIDESVFKYVDDVQSDKHKLECNTDLDSPQSDLLDFSSGSGEEWNIPKKPRKDLHGKKNKTINSSNKNLKKGTLSSTGFSTNAKTHGSKVAKKNLKCDFINKAAKSNNALVLCEKMNGTQLLEKAGELNEFKDMDAKGMRVEEIINKNKNEYKNIKSVGSVETCNDNNERFKQIKQELIKSNEESKVCEQSNIGSNEINTIHIIPQLTTPKKSDNQSSLGWSRLLSTKKEFHMSEKKKLPVATLNKSKSNSALNILTRTTDNLKSYQKKSPSNKLKESTNFIQCNSRVKKEKIASVLNSTTDCKSPFITSPTTDSPFKGFTSPEMENVCKEKCSVTQSSKDNLIKSGLLDCSLPVNKTNINENTICIGNEREQLNNIIPTDNFDQYQSCTKETINKTGNNITLCNTIFDIKTSQESKPKELQMNESFGIKNKRDSGIHNDSTFSPPPQKKICLDAVTQTSPANIKSFVGTVIKDVWGIEAYDFFQENLNKFSKRKKILNESTQLSITTKEDCKNNDDNKESNDFKVKENECPVSLSQRSDKENVDVNNKTCIANIYTDSYNDQTVSAKCLYDKFRDVIDDHTEVDPDAPTQPYKTPKLSKELMKPTSINLFSAVSNPTDSEIKNVNEIFSKDDIMFPEDTPKCAPVFDQSGIQELNSDTENSSPSNSSQTSFKNGKKSRRQLDFIDESSTDVFDTIQNEDDVIFKGEGNLVQQFHAHYSPSHNNIKDKVDVIEKNENSILEDGSYINKAVVDVISLENEGRLTYNPVNNVTEITSENTVQSKIDETPGIVFSSEMQKDIMISPETNEEDLFVEGTPDTHKTNFQKNQSTNNKNEIPTATMDADKSLTNLSEKNTEKNLENDMSQSETPEGLNDNAKKEVELSLVEKEKLCFASSMLDMDQRFMLEYVLKDLNWKFSNTVGPHVSHLIVGADNGRCSNTYKVLHTIAQHKPVITFEWVRKVCETGRVVPMTPYVAMNDTGNYPLNYAYLDKDHVLLKQFAIHVYNASEDKIKKQQLEELIRLCGGTVIEKLDEFQTVPQDKIKICIHCPECPDTSMQDWHQKYSAVDVVDCWLYSTIGNYKVAPLQEYIYDQDQSFTATQSLTKP